MSNPTSHLASSASPVPPVPPVPPASRRRRRWRAALVTALAVLLPLGGATAWALDRFVVEHVEIDDVSAYEASQGLDAGGASGQGATADVGAGASTGTSAATSAGTGTVDGDTYTSDATSITVSRVTTGSGDDTLTYYVADVVLSDMTDLRSAFAQDAFGTNIRETTSDIAADNGAVLAVNGDYYGFRDTGIVIRNGVVYRDEGAREGLALYRDGHGEVYDETTTDAQSLVDAGVWNTLSFGPALVEDGEIVAGIDDVEVDTNVGNHSIQGEQPRTAIGVVDENHLLLVVVDGRQEGYSRGATTTELAEILQDLGATTAYNIDGGGSSTLWFDGEVVNSPSQGRERGTSDVLYVADGA
ncbi:phosphodiester glycosidase family protein [Cellulosimicrobium cellulans]|uniref:phosphodiester glycosidase family protein n=1 Tax=Cellulosimicrobium cellulans TaxID=1710 RepID=UPI00188452D3|nr:phosphodiester glycosidase family protein [Cellulosimicrobium cellulans]MBE9938411.1 phosphodiester glycosidase family protein [Cellulosimicrobium cellulans]